MRVYLCVAVMLYAIVLVHSEMEPEMKKKFDECKKEFEMSEESLKSPDFDDMKIKCFSACILKKDDRITDGKLSIDKEVDEALKYIEKEKIDEAFHDKIAECVNEANEEKDDCGIGGAFFKCIWVTFGPMAA